MVAQEIQDGPLVFGRSHQSSLVWQDGFTHARQSSIAIAVWHAAMRTVFQEPTPWRLRWQEIKLPLDAFQFAEKTSRFSWFLARVSICIWDVASCAYPWFSDGSSLSSAFYYFVSVWDLWHQEGMWHDKCKHLLTPKSIRSPFSPKTDYNLSRRSLVKSATRSWLSIAGVGMSTQLMLEIHLTWLYGKSQKVPNYRKSMSARQ